MKFGFAWTFVNKLRGGTPAPPPEKRTPALPRLPACRALSRQIGKGIFRAMLAVFRTGRRQHLAFGGHVLSPGVPHLRPSKNGTTAACHTRLHRAKQALKLWIGQRLPRGARRLACGFRIGPPQLSGLVSACWGASDILNGGFRPIAVQAAGNQAQGFYYQSRSVAAVHIAIRLHKSGLFIARVSQNARRNSRGIQASPPA